MTASDNKFFEKYKKLEAACNGIYSVKSGVSEYISDMEKHAYDGKSGVSDWEKDYKALKHLRWVRNQIAHNPDGGSVCKKEDLKALSDFYVRLLNREDPISRLKKSKRRKAEHRRGKENAVYFLTAFIITVIFIIAAIVLIAR